MVMTTARLSTHHQEIEPEYVLQRVPRVLEAPSPPDHIAGEEQHCTQNGADMEGDCATMCS